jgi:hypothetical protein
VFRNDPEASYARSFGSSRRAASVVSKATSSSVSSEEIVFIKLKRNSVLTTHGAGTFKSSEISRTVGTRSRYRGRGIRLGHAP